MGIERWALGARHWALNIGHWARVRVRVRVRVRLRVRLTLATTGAAKRCMVSEAVSQSVLVRIAKGEVEPHNPSGTAVKVQSFADVTKAVVVLEEKLSRRALPRRRRVLSAL